MLNFRGVMAELTNTYLTSETEYVNTYEFTQDNAQIAVTGATLSISNASIWTDLDNGTHYYADFDVLSTTDSTLNAVTATVHLPDGSFWNVTTDIWVRFTTLRNVYQEAMSSLNASMGPLLLELNTAIDSLANSDTGYALRESLLDPLSSSLRFQCAWCATPDNATLSSIVQTRLEEFSQLTLLPTLGQISLDLQDLYTRYLSALAQVNEVARLQVVDVDLPALIATVEALYTDMEDNMYLTLKTSKEFMVELMRQLTPKCETDLHIIQKEVSVSQSGW